LIEYLAFIILKIFKEATLKNEIKIIIEATLIINVFDILELRDGKIILQKIKNKTTYRNPKFVENEKWGYSNFGIQKHLRTHEIDEDNNLRISRGAIDGMLGIFKLFNIKTNVVDRTLVLPTIAYNQSKTVRRDDQQVFIREMLKWTGGIGIGSTAFGKTLVGLELGADIGQPMMIIVHTTFLQEQWINEAVNPLLFNFDYKKIGGVGGIFKKPKLGVINVCLYHSLMNKKHRDIFVEKVGFVFFDESQKTPIEGIQQVVNQFRARYRFTATAEVKRKDGKECLTFDAFGPIRVKIEEKASDSKILSTIQLVKSDYFDKTYDEDNQHAAYLTRMARNNQRNILICKRAIRKIREGKLVLILVERKEHAGILFKMLSKFRGDMLVGAIGSKLTDETQMADSVKEILLNYDHDGAYDRILKLSYAKKLDYIIGTQKAEVGLNLRSLEHLIITTASGNNLERFNQQKGRVERTFDDKLIELYGRKKAIPTIDVIVDKDSISRKAMNNIKEKYTNSVVWIKNTDAIIIRRKHE